MWGGVSPPNLNKLCPSPLNSKVAFCFLSPPSTFLKMQILVLASDNFW
uniref:Uncharacterized protein n=1 Tax=Anguilla anguilla TaxID=7936 RepID=A0A0E9X9Q6_ANGAN